MIMHQSLGYIGWRGGPAAIQLASWYRMIPVHIDLHSYVVCCPLGVTNLLKEIW